MATRYKEIMAWARRRRDLLREVLGGCCASCGRKDELEFHHVDPGLKTWTTEDVGFVRSITLYWRDAVTGNIALLCRTCNARRSDRQPGWWDKVPKEVVDRVRVVAPRRALQLLSEPF